MAPVLDQGIHVADSVLDVGSGQGIDLVRYAQLGARAWGLDLTPRHVELALAHVASAGVEGKVVNGDAEQMPFEDNTFDHARSNGVLHHTPNMLAALGEIRRVLKPGGQARIVIYNRRSAYFWITLMLGYGVVRGMLLTEKGVDGVLARLVERTTVEARPLVRFYAPRPLRRLMRTAGFTDVYTTVHGFKPGNAILTRRLRHPRVLDFFERTIGEYVVVHGRA